jgi:hypothetical protein
MIGRGSTVIVKVTPTPYGAYIFEAVNPKIQKKIEKHMKEIRSSESDHTAYVSSEYDLPDFVSKKHRRLLAGGWPVMIRVDPWTALHVWGWDAHTLAE